MVRRRDFAGLLQSHSQEEVFAWGVAERLGEILGADVIGSRRVRNHIRFPSLLLFRRLHNTRCSICCLKPPDNRRQDVYTWFADRLTFAALSTLFGRTTLKEFTGPDARLWSVEWRQH